MRASKIISNNAVLAVRDDEDVVVLGTGVGFGLRVGDRVDGGRVERVFLAEDASDDRLSLMLADIPLPFLRVASRIAELAHERLNTRWTAPGLSRICATCTFGFQRTIRSRVPRPS